MGGSLFTTTFPCHNCARHIVAAGISSVFYIEPYEKSLALDLHHDAIASDSEDCDGRVRFMHFEGVAPRKYQDLFLAVSERKSSVGAERRKARLARKSAVQYLDSYRDLESKVVHNLVTQGGLTEHVIEELANPVVRTASSAND